MSSITDSSEQPIQQTALSERGKEIALMHFDHVEQQVSLAATTAGLIVAADALIIGAYVSVVSENQIFTGTSFSLSDLSFGFGGLLLVLSFLFALFAVFPNIRLASFRYTIENVVFFGWIGTQRFDDYFQTFIEKGAGTGEALDRELLYQIWGKSRWLTRMFRFIQLAVLCTITATLIVVITLLVGRFF